MQIGKNAQGKAIMSTKREQYEALEKGMGKTVPELHCGNIPQTIAYVWDMFAKVKQGASGKLTYQDIYYYCKLNNFTIEQFELDIILALDSKYWEIQND